MERSFASDPQPSKRSSLTPARASLSLPGASPSSAPLPSPRHRPVLPAAPAPVSASPSSVIVYNAAKGVLQRGPVRERGASVPSLPRTRRISDSRLNTSRGVSASMIPPDAGKISRAVSAAPSVANSPRRRATDDPSWHADAAFADENKYRVTVAGHPIPSLHGASGSASPPLPPGDLFAPPPALSSASPPFSVGSPPSPLGRPGPFPEAIGLPHAREKLRSASRDISPLRDTTASRVPSAPPFPPRPSPPSPAAGGKTSAFACPFCRRPIPLSVLQNYVNGHPQLCCPGRACSTSSHYADGRSEGSPFHFRGGAQSGGADRAGPPNELIDVIKRRQGKVWGPVPPSFFTSPYNTQYWFFI
ncbi:hypothetical protein NCLIV_007550 [Neospora caninum Liverpool]|uniref:Uncharacterized protein n=1 Tax=Neospora caninum (strain Liverpool) TaxID=572307 RepID=F0V956_NEOCL|nr:hypothetical protein NCLIV_007550 [Neospora caninum Liverpool]CBZ50281.1 hypothetical protein NCLIV_007550 [Neospora caninum Liverpool]CEL64886.1 TPA: hypothetical protein BN1204_007550 [Neospora caninum Liverpool]|eukprot:XP_003880315.1 hypothetical protein NCLIV_007550 [Neospora caninum Liverpool]